MDEDTQRPQGDGRDSGGELPGERAGDVIDRYRLIEPIGEGGMGSVWLAEQSDPVVRRVALKVIKLGMDTREVVVRFEAERQALALMEHPNIAKVLDGGATAKGRPFFVMELVDGEPITEFCDRHRLGLRRRLELFRLVCDAIQHAHQKGIIHRDIKPSNVLVTMRDGAPVPKVIDFGVAKATGAELTQKTMVTQHDQLVGTPEYMSPEQASMTGEDIDTRADVYSLGALLYELLTCTKPFDVNEILKKGYMELLRRIREVDPDRPSTRVSSLGGSPDTATSVAALTRLRLSTRLRGDLDWIVMKALEKERERRYATASELAGDIGRYLADETVTAVPPSAAYRVRKFVRRRKKTVAAVAAIVFLLVAGSISTALGWREANRARVDLEAEVVEKELQRSLAVRSSERASEAERQAREGEQRARAAEAEVRERAEELERVVRFQEKQLDELDVKVMGARMRASLLEAAPEGRRVEVEGSVAGINFTSLAMTILEQSLFDRTLAAIEAQFGDQPVVEGRLLASTSSTMHGLGLSKRAEQPMVHALELLRQHLGEEHEDTLALRVEYGSLLRDLDRYDDAVAQHRLVHETRDRLLGADHERTISAFHNIGRVLLAQGKLDEAEPYLIEALAKKRELLGEEHPGTISSRESLSQLRKQRGDYAAAEGEARVVLAFYQRAHGEDDRRTFSAHKLLGEMLWRQREFEEAEPHFRAAYDGTRDALGDDHPDALAALNDLGNLMIDLERMDEAERLMQEVVDRKRRALGPRHTSTMISLNNLGLLLEDLGRREDAMGLFRETREICLETLGAQHDYSLTATTNLARVLADLGQMDASLELMIESNDIGRVLYGEEHPRLAVMNFNLATTLRDVGRFEEATRFFADAVAQQRMVDGTQRYLLGKALGGLGICQIELGQFEAAEQNLLESIELEGGTSTAALYVPILSCALGAAVAGQGRHDEAERILVEASEKLVRVAGKDPQDAVGQAVERLVAFYRARDAAEPDAGHGEQADEWVRRLAGRPMVPAGEK